jgi:hypothetical protein
MTKQEDAMQQWEQAQQDYLEALIALETVAILDTSGLGRSALISDAWAALGMTDKQVWELARQRVLKRMSWRPGEAPS